jgi:hypothetical protein
MNRFRLDCALPATACSALVTCSSIPRRVRQASGGLRSGMPPGLGLDSGGGNQRAGIPGPLRGELADATGYPLRPHVLRQAAPGCLVILTRALRVPVLMATKGQQRSLQSSVAGFPQGSILLVGP